MAKNTSEVAAAQKSKAAPKPKAPKAKPAATTGGTPMIDTTLVAQSAARMLAAGAGGAIGTSATSRPSESAGFKQLKASLQKPTGGNSFAGSLLGGHSTAKKLGNAGNGPAAGPQVGRGQTFGADVNRSSVPRRTGGG